MPRRLQRNEFRHMVQVEKPVITRGTAGGSTETWEEFIKVRAAISFPRGDEVFQAAQLAALKIATVTTPWFPCLDETMRLWFDKKYWDITFINNVDLMNKQYIITVEHGLREP